MIFAFLRLGGRLFFVILGDVGQELAHLMEDGLIGIPGKMGIPAD